MNLTHLFQTTFSFLVLIVLSSCLSSTKFSVATGGCQHPFRTGEKLLMAEIEGISPYQSSLFYQSLNKKIIAKNLLLAYAAEEDMNLRLHQITAKSDTSNLKRMSNLSYNYYLKIKLLNSKSGEVYGTFSKETVEAKRFYSPPEEEPEYTSAVVQFSLYSTSAKKLIYTLTTTTEMRPVNLSKKDGGQRFYNLSDSRQALNKAFNKSVKRMLKDCHCCL